MGSRSKGNVLLIDPIDAVSDLPQEFNGTPNYEDMFIFVGLRTKRRKRSVIRRDGNETTLVESDVSDFNINMLGYDQNSGEFTTKWTEAETEPILEGFGITNINIKTNSSYIPQVSIEFVDIRGLAFFNRGSQSPYQALFDFPPPLFELTVKGYYGRALTYQLHLVRHSTQFQSETGNFVINAEFIARTFAPLTDIPFKYVDILPLLEQETQEAVDSEIQQNTTPQAESIDTSRINLNNFVPPKNTHELLKRLKNLYDGISEVKESSSESETLNESQDTLDRYLSSINLLNSFKNRLADNQLQKNASIMIGQIQNPNGGGVPEYRIVNGVNSFNQVIQSDNTLGNNTNKNERLFLTVKAPTGNSEAAIMARDAIIQVMQVNDNGLNGVFYQAILDGDPPVTPQPSNDFTFYPNLKLRKLNGTDINESYIALDITNYYIKLNDGRIKAQNRLQEAEKALSRKINNTVILELGFEPTIYDVFKIICDDIDKLFNILRKTNLEAEIHHKKFSSQILRNIKQSKISAFPLYVSGNTGKCNVSREVRQYPIRLSTELLNNGGEPFPEITLVDNFVNAFIRLQKELLVTDLRGQEDAQGNNKWIPITPFDSELLNSVYGRKESPYANIEFQYIGLIDNHVDKILNKVLERYYVASQYSFGRTFYSGRNNLVKLIAGSEAVNVAISQNNQGVIDNLRTLSQKLSNGNLQTISNRLKNLPTYSKVDPYANQTTTKYVKIGNTGVSDLTETTTIQGNDVTFLYKDRIIDNYPSSGESAYIGFEIIKGSSVLRSTEENNDNPVDQFINENSGLFNTVKRFFSGDQEIQFSVENIILDQDIQNDSGSYITKYMNGSPNPEWKEIAIRGLLPSSIFFVDKLVGYNFTNSFTKVISDILSNNFFAGEFISEITGGTSITGDDDAYSAAKGFLIGSNFLKARSYYDQSTGNINANKGDLLNKSFTNPAVVEVPYFSALYMGGIVRYLRDSNFKKEVDRLLTKFIGTTDEAALVAKGDYDISHFESDRYFINALMLPQDQNRLLNIFNNFIDNSIHITLERSYQNIINSSLQNAAEEYIDSVTINGGENVFGQLLDYFSDKAGEIIADVRGIFAYIQDGDFRNQYEQILQSNIQKSLESSFRQSICERLFEKYLIIVPSEFSFYIPPFENNEISQNSVETNIIEPLEITNENQLLSSVNVSYFQEFFSVLSEYLDNQKEVVSDIENQATQSINDNDIKGQLYYSFKSISDKWIAGLGSDITKGFPLNEDGKKLIDSFMFVDRAMNPIGSDCIIDIEPLLEMSQDYDLNVFSVFSQLLSHNGFEFFPLQNFMSFQNAEWEESFKLKTNIDQRAHPAFVCMYIGGAASQLDNESSEYDDDGIQDLAGDDLPDFVGGCIDEPDSNISELVQTNGSNTIQPYAQVRAFKVRFAEQNQSYFTKIQLDGREFTETNDSLAILSKIAGDESNSSPVAKGQNLFSVYENRAYSAKITMLGDVMIQPTQYFQLENIPMYSGAYVILEVEHIFTPNHALTQFTGTKLLKYPNPIVTEFAVKKGYQSGRIGDSEQLALASIAEDGIVNLSDIKRSPLYEDAVKEGFVDAFTSAPIPQTSSPNTNKKLLELHPQIRKKAIEFVEEIRNRFGVNMIVSQSTRTITQQAQLYSQGRTTSGDIVTNAPAGNSYHNYGLAFDVAFVVKNDNGNNELFYGNGRNKLSSDGTVSEYSDISVLGNNITWQEIGRIAEDKYNFRWGGNQNTPIVLSNGVIDVPHFQYIFRHTGIGNDEFGLQITISDLKELLLSGRNLGTYPIIPESYK